VTTLFFILLQCLNLSQAQVTTPAAPRPQPSSAGAAVNTAIKTVNEEKPNLESTTTSGKYEEFQSICRVNEFDIIAHYTESTKAKRIEILKARIASEPDSNKPKLWLIKEYVDQKKLPEAESFLKELRSLRLKPAELNYAEAAVSYLKGDQKKSRDLLNKILNDNPKDVIALKLLAEVYKTESNYFEASAIYIDLIKLTRENFNEQLCEAYTLDAHYSDAEERCQNSNNKNPFFSIYLGIGAREQGNLKGARRYFINSLQVRETEMALVCLGEIYTMEKKPKDAIATLEKAVRLVPQSTRAQVALAWAYFNEKNRSQALIHFQKACKLQRKSVVEVRKSLKILLEEKSEHIAKFSDLAQSCESL